MYSVELFNLIVLKQLISCQYFEHFAVIENFLELLIWFAAATAFYSTCLQNRSQVSVVRRPTLCSLSTQRPTWRKKISTYTSLEQSTKSSDILTWTWAGLAWLLYTSLTWQRCNFVIYISLSPGKPLLCILMPNAESLCELYYIVQFLCAF